MSDLLIAASKNLKSTPTTSSLKHVIETVAFFSLLVCLSFGFLLL